MSEVRPKVETHLVASVGCTPHQHPSITIRGSVSLLDDIHPRAAPSVGSGKKTSKPSILHAGSPAAAGRKREPML